MENKTHCCPFEYCAQETSIKTLMSITLCFNLLLATVVNMYILIAFNPSLLLCCIRKVYCCRQYLFAAMVYYNTLNDNAVDLIGVMENLQVEENLRTISFSPYLNVRNNCHRIPVIPVQCTPYTVYFYWLVVHRWKEEVKLGWFRPAQQRSPRHLLPFYRLVQFYHHPPPLSAVS